MSGIYLPYEKLSSFLYSVVQPCVWFCPPQKEPLQFRVMVETLLYVGLRKSELHGLQWGDLDFNSGVLRIERELQYLQKQGLHVRPPKNASSIRAIKLPAALIATLRYYRAWQSRQAKLVADRWKENDWMFTDEFGSPRHPDSLPKQFKQFLSRAGFTPEEAATIHLHTLRHSCATFLIAARVDIRTVSNRLGHAQTNTTLNTYSHALRQADEAAAEALEFTLNRRKRA